MTDGAHDAVQKPSTSSRKWRWWHYLLAVVGLFVLSQFVLTDFGRFREYFYCRRCGMHLYTLSYQIPFTTVTLTSRSTEEPTPFSEAMFKHGFVGPHRHTWKFAYGRGNNVACATGFYENRTVYFRTGRNDLNFFLDMLVEYRGRTAAERWCQRVLRCQDRREGTIVPGPPMHMSREEFNAFVKIYGEELMLDKETGPSIGIR